MTLLPLLLVSGVLSSLTPHPAPSPFQGEGGVRVSGFTADVRTTLTFPRAPHLTTEAKVLKAGPLVRYESREAGEEVLIYDFARQRLIRLILAQRLAFESLIPPRFLAKAQRESLVSVAPHPGIVVQRIRLGEAVVEGRRCDIVLIVKSLAGRPGMTRRSPSPKEYTLVWEARDLGVPVRVSYSQPDRSVVLVEYRNLRAAMLDPAVFQPPADFLSASPF